MAAHDRRWPYGVVGIVMAFEAASAARAAALRRVGLAWSQAFENSVELWEALAAARWPQLGRRRSLPRSPAAFRLLLDAERRLRPIPHVELHPIENCDFAFRCPQFAEMLQETGERDESGRLVLFCNVCRDRVFTVESQEELDGSARLGRCVRFHPPLGAPLATSGSPVEAMVHCLDAAVGTTFLVALLHLARVRGKECSATIPGGTSMKIRFATATVSIAVVVHAEPTSSSPRWSSPSAVGHHVLLHRRLHAGSSRTTSLDMIMLHTSIGSKVCQLPSELPSLRPGDVEVATELASLFLCGDLERQYAPRVRMMGVMRRAPVVTAPPPRAVAAPPPAKLDAVQAAKSPRR